MDQVKVPRRILTALIHSVSAGVVPRLGAPYIAIGRNEEIQALLRDLKTADEGGCSMRLVIGKYGSGKSFLMQLMRDYALEQGFLCLDADLSPERRLCGGKGSGKATYRELVKNMSSRTCPEGGALPSVISRWLSSLQSEVAADGFDPSDEAFEKEVQKRVYAILNQLEGQVGGFDFAHVISLWYGADKREDDDKKSSCLRWLRGEYETKSEARRELGTGTIIDDESWYDFIKLLAVFVKIIGYRGLVVFLDECVNLYKIPNRISRENNYEKILSMFNDTLQGRAPGLVMILGGTPQFLEDTRRGLFSYEALRSRLSDGRYGTEQYRNMLSPVIRLRRLSDNELYALVNRLTDLHGRYYDWTPRATDADIQVFLTDCLSRAGADVMITPREMIRDYLMVLDILYQHPELDFSQVIGSGAVTLSHPEPGQSEDVTLITDESPVPATKPIAVTFDDLNF